MAKRWIASSFDDVFIESQSSSTTTAHNKRRFDSSQNNFSSTKTTHVKDTPWIECFAPAKRDDLAVQKKKMEQVEAWLLESLSSEIYPERDNSTILVLTGPPGAGKTATVQTLAKEHNIDVLEWQNKERLVDSANWKIDNPIEESEMHSFNNFLTNASRYKSLFQHNSRQITLVEEFPNMVYLEASLFHHIIRKLSKVARTPTVFIVSSNSSGDMLDQKLFPKVLQEELKISEISFNPITTLSIVRVLNSILSEPRVKEMVLMEKDDLHALAESASGDIRNAINKLQFSRKNSKKTKMKRVWNKGSKRTMKKTPVDVEDKTSAGGKDTTLQLFHALGKILYCKRVASSEVKEPKLPKHLVKFERTPLVEVPEKIFERTATSGDIFSMYLHENFLDFFTDLEKVVRCSETFSSADFLRSEWAYRDALSSYSLSTASREIMFQSADEKSLGFHRLRKPACYEAKRKRENMQSDVRNEFKELKFSFGVDLETVLLPYMAKIDSTSLTQGQKFLTASVVFFNRNLAESFKLQKQALQIAASQAPENPEEIDYVIEEIDD